MRLEPVVMRLVMPALPEVVPQVRHSVRSYLERLGIASVAMVELAVSEAVTNAVAHAYRETGGGEVEVMVSVGPDLVEVIVSDDGSGLLGNSESDGAGVDSS